MRTSWRRLLEDTRDMRRDLFANVPPVEHEYRRLFLAEVSDLTAEFEYAPVAPEYRAIQKPAEEEADA